MNAAQLMAAALAIIAVLWLAFDERFGHSIATDLPAHGRASESPPDPIDDMLQFSLLGLFC